MPEKISITAIKSSEAVLFTPPGDKEDVFVISVVDPSKNIFSALRASNKTPYNFKSTDMVIKIDASPLFPSSVIGPILLALK